MFVWHRKNVKKNKHNCSTKASSLHTQKWQITLYGFKLFVQYERVTKRRDDVLFEDINQNTNRFAMRRPLCVVYVHEGEEDQRPLRHLRYLVRDCYSGEFNHTLGYNCKTGRRSADLCVCVCVCVCVGKLETVFHSQKYCASVVLFISFNTLFSLFYYRYDSGSHYLRIHRHSDVKLMFFFAMLFFFTVWCHNNIPATLFEYLTQIG